LILPVEYRTVIKKRLALEKCLKCSVCHKNCIASLYSDIYDLKNTFIFDVFTRGAINNKNLWNCSACDYCYERCPYDVNTIEVLEALKEEAFRRDLAPKSVNDHVELTISTGFGFLITKHTHRLREELGLPPLKPKRFEDLKRISEETGLDKVLMELKEGRVKE